MHWETVRTGFHVIVHDFLGKSRKFENGDEHAGIYYSPWLSAFDFKENTKKRREQHSSNPNDPYRSFGGRSLQANPSVVPEFVKTYHKQTWCICNSLLLNASNRLTTRIPLAVDWSRGIIYRDSFSDTFGNVSQSISKLLLNYFILGCETENRQLLAQLVVDIFHL